MADAFSGDIGRPQDSENLRVRQENAFKVEMENRMGRYGLSENLNRYRVDDENFSLVYEAGDQVFKEHFPALLEYKDIRSYADAEFEKSGTGFAPAAIEKRGESENQRETIYFSDYDGEGSGPTLIRNLASRHPIKISYDKDGNFLKVGFNNEEEEISGSSLEDGGIQQVEYGDILEAKLDKEKSKIVLKMKRRDGKESSIILPHHVDEKRIIEELFSEQFLQDPYGASADDDQKWTRANLSRTFGIEDPELPERFRRS